jgi:hypothetical protein
MKKQLLNESDIRRMMKFANIAPLTDGFVERLNEASETTAPEEDDTLEEGEDEKVQEEGMGAYGKVDDLEEVEHEGEPADEMPPADDELPVDDELPAEEPGAEGEMTLSDEEADVLIDLGKRLAAAQGDEEPMGDLDLGAEDDLDLEAGGDDEEMPMEEDLDEELVNEVIARVARRLRSSE